MYGRTTHDCQFKEACQTFQDPLVQKRRKGAGGLGCFDQTDAHRTSCCKPFRTMRLCQVVARRFGEWCEATAGVSEESDDLVAAGVDNGGVGTFVDDSVPSICQASVAV